VPHGSALNLAEAHFWPKLAQTSTRAHQKRALRVCRVV